MQSLKVDLSLTDLKLSFKEMLEKISLEVLREIKEKLEGNFHSEQCE